MSITPTMENLQARLRHGHNELFATGVVAGPDVHLTVAMKVGNGDSKVLGTLVIPLCDSPALGAMLTIGASMMRFNFDYRLLAGKAEWRNGDEAEAET